MHPAALQQPYTEKGLSQNVYVGNGLCVILWNFSQKRNQERHTGRSQQ